jgi:L-rhamnose mutarotase
MKRAGFLLKVRDDPKLQAEYKQRHREVWPDMLAALRRHGWRNYSLFMREDGLMFGHVEVPVSLQHCLDAMAKEEVNLRWQKDMQPYFEIPPGARPDQTMVQLEEVFFMAGAGLHKPAARRMCFQLKVKPDAHSISEYKRTHAAVWPDMLAALTRHGWSNYSIWMRPDGTIYLYSEMALDPREAEAGMAKEEVQARWAVYMRPLFETGDDGSTGRRTEMEEVFHTD